MLISVRELNDNWNIRPTGVVHVGAHLAEESSDYENFGWTPVIWVEAQPNLVKQLKVNLNKSTHTVIEAAVWSENDVELDLNLASNSQSTSLLKFGTHKEHYPDILFTQSIRVKTKRLDRLIPESTCPNFLNMDLQGIELKALEGLGELIHKFDYIFSEVNFREVYEDCSKVQDIDHYLKEFGFARVLTRWYFKEGWGDALYVRRNTLEDRHLNQILNTKLSTFRFYLRQLGSLLKAALLGIKRRNEKK